MDKKTIELLLNLVLQNNGSNKEQKDQDGNGELRIVILQRGWVFVGDYYSDGENCRLENASCIRNWGTTNGLGELAENGPLSETKLDPTPTVKFHRLGEVCTILCNEKIWKK